MAPMQHTPNPRPVPKRGPAAAGSAYSTAATAPPLPRLRGGGHRARPPSGIESLQESRKFYDHRCRADINATLVAMGYRGEDASRTRADSRRQPPWQSSSAAGPGAARPWDDGSQGYGEGPRGYYGQHEEYAADDGYRGYPQGNPYAGYDEYEAYGQDDGYGPSGGYGYGQPPEYGQRARYGDDGSGYRGDDGSGYRGDDGYGGGEVTGYGNVDPYGYPGGAGGGYPQGTGYSGGYGHPPQGYGGGGNGQQAFGYPAGGYAGSGDYPVQPAGPRPGSGGYPALTA